MGGESASSPRRIEANRKQRRALELRRAGATFQGIADELGYANPMGAYKAVMSALRRTLQEPADEVRKLEVERLDRLWLELYAQATNRDSSAQTKQFATDRLVKLMERRAKLLGLDVPQRVAGDSDMPVLVKHIIAWSGNGAKSSDDNEDNPA